MFLNHHRLLTSGRKTRYSWYSRYRVENAPKMLHNAALKSGGSAQNESEFSVISSRRQTSGRRDGFRSTPLRMCSCGRGLARACLLVVPWSVCLGRPAESRARPGRANSAAEIATVSQANSRGKWTFIEFSAICWRRRTVTAATTRWCCARPRRCPSTGAPATVPSARGWIVSATAGRPRIEPKNGGPTCLVEER
jgi:hypothetical protein